VGNHRLRRSWSAEGGRAGRAVTSTCLDLDGVSAAMSASASRASWGPAWTWHGVGAAVTGKYNNK